MGKSIAQLAGQKFGRLTAQMVTGSNKFGRILWLCSCECGGTSIVPSRALISGNTKSCGCLSREVAASNLPHGKGQESGKFRHGESHKTPEYGSWCNMKNRCYNPKTERYGDYGGRGITVCERWRAGAEGYCNFLADMGRKPSAAHSLDRIDVNGHYEPANCRWANSKEQYFNRRCHNVEDFSDAVLREECLRRGWKIDAPRL